jgi:hypothetical protein
MESVGGVEEKDLGLEDVLLLLPLRLRFLRTRMGSGGEDCTTLAGRCHRALRIFGAVTLLHLYGNDRRRTKRTRKQEGVES